MAKNSEPFFAAHPPAKAGFGRTDRTKSLAHELESCAVIEGYKPDKQILLESGLATLSNRVKRGR